LDYPAGAAAKDCVARVPHPAPANKSPAKARGEETAEERNEALAASSCILRLEALRMTYRLRGGRKIFVMRYLVDSIVEKKQHLM
jgi:hypothetical protein